MNGLILLVLGVAVSLLKEALESHDENPDQARSLLARIEFSTLEDNEKILISG